jgi:hypothetical protein
VNEWRFVVVRFVGMKQQQKTDMPLWEALMLRYGQDLRNGGKNNFLLSHPLREETKFAKFIGVSCVFFSVQIVVSTSGRRYRR